MWMRALDAARDLPRLKRIAKVLVRHGMGDVARRLGLASWLDRVGGSGLSEKPTPRHVREALEELGPTFVKVGQLLAGRVDLLPPAWLAELSLLHEHAAPVPFPEIRERLQEALGQAPEALFRDLDPVPLAAASIAQVHRATLHDGTRVVLKVRRPGIRQVVEADLRLIERLAERVEQRFPEARRLRPRRLALEFGRSLRDELDLRVEASHAERLAQNLAGEEGLVLPRVHGEFTHEELCVLDFLPGPSLGRWLEERGDVGQERAEIARRGAEACLRMVFVDGFFHADPHPGNVLLVPCPDGRTRLGLVDFGMVGRLSPRRRLEFLELLAAIGERREEDVADLLMGWSGDLDVDRQALVEDCAGWIERYSGASLAEIDTGELLRDLYGLLRRNGLVLPNDLALLFKLFMTLEGLGRALDPDFVMAEHVRPFAERALREASSPAAFARRGSRELRHVLRSLPRELGRILDMARRGHIGLEIRQMERFGERIERSANRLTLGLITSALIVGAAISMTVPAEPRVLGLPLFGFLGFVSSCAVGVLVFVSIVRSHRR